jgi:hypothetical protein
MGAICRFIGFFVKLLFGLSLVGLGVLGLQNANKIESRLTQSISGIAGLTKQPLLTKLNEFTDIIKHVDSALLIIAGLFLVLNFKGASFFALLSVALQIALVHNPLLYKDQKTLVLAIKYIAILGGVLTVA